MYAASSHAARWDNPEGSGRGPLLYTALSSHGLPGARAPEVPFTFCSDCKETPALETYFCGFIQSEFRSKRAVNDVLAREKWRIRLNVFGTVIPKGHWEVRKTVLWVWICKNTQSSNTITLNNCFELIRQNMTQSIDRNLLSVLITFNQKLPKDLSFSRPFILLLHCMRLF